MVTNSVSRLRVSPTRVDLTPTSLLAGNRLPTLTGLRAIAAGLVFLRHVGGLLPPGTAQDRWLRIFGVGLDGVSFFFLLSGFLLAWSYRTDDTPQRFYRRRAARIGPNHVATWVIAVPLVTMIDGVRPSGRVLLSTFTLTQAWVPNAKFFYGVNGVEWSLSCEILFYLLLPLLIGPLSRHRSLRLGAGTAAVGVVLILPLLLHPYLPSVLGDLSPSWREWMLYNFPLTRLAEFVLGVVLGLAFREGWRPDLSWRFGACVAVAGVVVSAFLFTAESVTAVTLLPFAAVIVAGATADLRCAHTALSSPTWVRLGEWSFAFYLVHQLVVRMLVHHLSGPVSVRLLVWAPAALAASVALSMLLFVVVERPCERRFRSAQPARRTTQRT